MIRRWHVLLALALFLLASVTGNDCDGKCAPQYELFR